MKKKVFLRCVEGWQNRISELKRAMDKQLETILAQKARIRELEAKGARAMTKLHGAMAWWCIVTLLITAFLLSRQSERNEKRIAALEARWENVQRETDGKQPDLTMPFPLWVPAPDVRPKKPLSELSTEGEIKTTSLTLSIGPYPKFNGSW